MFLEVYAIPLIDHTKDTEISKTTQNRRLVSMEGARLRPNLDDPARADIVFTEGISLCCAGSYDELATRLSSVYPVARM